MKRSPIAPGPESVWDHPRPPRVEPSGKHIRVVLNGETIAETDRAFRVLETSHPPVYYIPLQDVRTQYLRLTPHRTFCEFKGNARYYTVAVEDRREENAAWYYPNPSEGYREIQNYVAFYPGRMDACYVDGEQVRAQPGNFYGGWITREIVGPFKGEPGTMGW